MTFLLLSLGWWALMGGVVDGVVWGAIVVALATVASRMAWTRPASGLRWRPFGLLRLTVFFLAGSLRGGAAVAGRAMARHLVISPAMVRYVTYLPPGPAQETFMIALNLMPGTVTVDVQKDGKTLTIHVLVAEGEMYRQDIQALEAQVAAALSVDPSAPEIRHG